MTEVSDKATIVRTEVIGAWFVGFTDVGRGEGRLQLFFVS